MNNPVLAVSTSFDIMIFHMGMVVILWVFVFIVQRYIPLAYVHIYVHTYIYGFQHTYICVYIQSEC